ncbi:MAG: hypothetical protein SGILL_005403 [Bacillariaceae sp.]
MSTGGGEAGDSWRQMRSDAAARSNDINNNNPNDNSNPSNNTSDIRADIRAEMEGFNRQRSASSSTPTRVEEEDPDAGLLPPSDDFNSSSPWRGRGGDNDGRSRIIRRDSGSGRQEQKIVDLSTPTLVDEEDYYENEEEEREMIALEHERIRRHASAPIGAYHNRTFFVNEQDVRRTPGSSMYRSGYDQALAAASESARRTPGAGKMHASAVPSTTLGEPEPPASTTTDASGLGFGLTLSTPIATSESRAKQQMGSISRSTWEPPQSTPGGNKGETRSNISSGGALASAWSMMKNQEQQQGQGQNQPDSARPFSPNTLRLTEDLDNLLLDDDASEDTRKFNQFVFRNTTQPSKTADASSQQQQQQGSESWTASYVVNREQPARVPRVAAGRGRKNRLEQNRRARGGFSGTAASSYSHGSSGSSNYPRSGGGFVPHAQAPTPVRNTQLYRAPAPMAQLPSGAPNFSSYQGPGPIGQPSFGGYAFQQPSGSNSPPVNFGGAFSPPSKTPIGPASSQKGPPHSTAEASEPQRAREPRQSPVDLQALPPFPTQMPNYAVGSAQMPHQSQSMQPPAGFRAPTPPHFGVPPQGNFYPGGQPVPHPHGSHSPSFNYPHPQNMAYAMPPGMHQAVLPGMGPPPGLPQFSASPQPWPQGMPMQYEGMASHPQQAVHGGWPMGGFQQEQYMMRPPPQSSEHSASGRMSATSTPSVEPPSSLEARLQRQTSTPSPATGRPPSRGSKPRKGPSRKWSGKGQTRSGSTTPEVPSGTPTFGRKTQSGIKGGRKKGGKATPVPGERPSSTVSDGGDSTVAAVSDDPAEAKRAELIETPAIRSAFKEFYRKFRAEEKISLKGGEAFALRSLKDGSVPESVHWRVYIELADLSKRANQFEEARKLYQKACQLQPYASQVWLEYSKLEEECGNMAICTKILAAGLECCEYNENLLSRAIKHEEKLGNLPRARELLARLKHVGIEKVWRSVLEGALLEGRAGNDPMARRVLKYLMHHVPWYGPLYLEAFKLEKDLGRSEDALAIVEKGLGAIPRYGPLWFGAFRLCEEIDVKEQSYDLPRSTGMIERAIMSISKELLWKVHLEAAQMLERSSTEYMDASQDSSAIIERCRKRFAMTIVTCPPSLRWKVWLAAGRMEVAAGNPEVARRLILNSHKVVPDKGRAVALLECARLEEYVGDVELASAILCKSRLLGGSDWKVWLESVMLSIRSGDYPRAIVLSQQALQQHSGTGRLWASLIQLRHFSEGEQAQFESLGLALNAVPKSGEVWCEGARIHLNPFSQTFDLQRASRHLYFATKFTPQYGDGFLESLRLLIVAQLLMPIAALIWEETKGELVGESDEEWNESIVKYLFKLVCEMYRIRDIFSPNDDVVKPSDKNALDSYLGDIILRAFRERVYSESVTHFLDISRLELRCGNADPNYGPMWFYCRSRSTDTARVVLSRAVDIVLDDVKFHANVYIAALVRRFAITSRFEQKRSQGVTGGSAAWEKLIDKECLSVPSLKHIYENGSDTAEEGVEFLESSIPPSDFITGIVALSRHRPVEEMSSYERRKMLFGADSIFS